MRYFAYSLIIFFILGIFSFTIVSAETIDIDKNNPSITIDSENSFLIAENGDETPGPNDGDETPGPNDGDETSETGISLTNPLGSENTTISGILDNIIRGLRDTLAPPIVAIAVLYGGFLMLFSGGNPEKFNQGKKAIGYAVAGYIIIWLASGISALIRNILTGG